MVYNTQNNRAIVLYSSSGIPMNTTFKKLGLSPKRSVLQCYLEYWAVDIVQQPCTFDVYFCL
jgi:hypothetical protein